MNRRILWVFGLSIGLAANVPAWGLDIGDPAPKLHVAEWIKGDAVDLQKDSAKRIHVVEFWAVWCPPCKESIPLLSKIQDKYKDDVAVIGVTAADDRGNTPSAVRRFVKEQGSSLTYRIAMDDRDQTTNAYLVAARALGIPHAFIVGKDSKIAWQGSPLDPEMESVLAGLLSGKYDPKIEAEVNKRFQSLEYALRRGQWDVVAKGLTEILKIAPGNETALRSLRRVYVDEWNKIDEFRTWAKEHIAANRSNASAMANLAAILLEGEDFTRRLPDLVLDASKASYEAAQPPSIDTITIYALALYQIGAIDRALALQREAVDATQGEERRRAQQIYDYYSLCKQLQGSTQ